MIMCNGSPTPCSEDMNCPSRDITGCSAFNETQKGNITLANTQHDNLIVKLIGFVSSLLYSTSNVSETDLSSPV